MSSDTSLHHEDDEDEDLVMSGEQKINNSEKPSRKKLTSSHDENMSRAFNSLSLTSHSPRPTRRNGPARRHRHRHRPHGIDDDEEEDEEDEIVLEKQRRDKRLRMSQEIQRKLDEIQTRLDELERDGVELEKTICSLDASSLSVSHGSDAGATTTRDTLATKEKLEQELYNLIHEKNLLTRIENELNIQLVFKFLILYYFKKKKTHFVKHLFYYIWGVQ